MTTFGRTTENSSTIADVASKIHGTRFTIGTAADTVEVLVRLSNTGAGHSGCAAKVAIYTTADGEPDELITYSDPVSIADDLPAQWVTFPVEVHFEPGTFVLAVWANADSTGVQLYGLNYVGHTYFRDWESSGEPADPFDGSPSDFYAMELNIYATDTPGAMQASGSVEISGSVSIYTPGDLAIEASGVLGLYGGYAELTAYEDLVASGTIAISGGAWLSSRAHGQDTLAANGFISFRPRWTRMNTGETWPATDADGWTAPDVTPPDIREDA